MKDLNNKSNNFAVNILSPAMNRRTFLRGTGVALALPFLEAMMPNGYVAEKGSSKPPIRMVVLMNSLSLIPKHFFPKKAGYDYENTPYLNFFKAHRKNMTVMSGVSLPDVAGGHGSLPCFLTGAPQPGSPGFRNSISMDVVAAEHIGEFTRIPFMPIMIAPSNGGAERGEPMSFTSAGVPIPGATKASKLFSRMFLQGDKRAVQAQLTRLKEEQSILDMLVDRTKKLNQKIGKADRDKLDQYFQSIRELERRMVNIQEWEKKAKPKTDAKMPKDMTTFTNGVEQHKVIFDVMKLALQTDSTRIISLFIDTTVIHNITHHGNRPETLAELRGHEERQFDALNDFLTQLDQSRDGDRTLLDQTMVLYGTCMGSANSHSNVNLPVLLAGGGFQHGQHLVFDHDNNYPLSNLYVSMLQRMGIETDRFSTGTGRMNGLEFAN